MPTATGLKLNFPSSSTRSGIFFGESAECPCNNVRCNPTPSVGFSRASLTASANPGSLTIRLALVRMPSWCARMTASLMLAEPPKSSALTISLRASAVEAGVGATVASCLPEITSSRSAIVRHHSSGKHAIQRAQNQQQLLSAAHARRIRAEDIEALQFQFAEQPPIDRSHQLCRGHRAPVLFRQNLARTLIVTPRVLSHVRCQCVK